jgi:pyrroline-5-carboxylate reductase
MHSVLFIGGGKMMQAIAGGLIARRTSPAHIFAVEPDAAATSVLRSKGITVFSEGAAALAVLGNVDAVILAVKPQVMREALLPFSGHIADQLVLSIAAGVRVSSLIRWLDADGKFAGHAQIVRAMPNTPALIGAGISGLYAAPNLAAKSRVLAEVLLASVGKVAWFDDEAMLDAVTAVSGSGPAYVFYFIEALEEAAIEMGFAPDAARIFALETFRGASLLASQSEDSPTTLRANVTSRKGTTEAAIAAFDRNGLKKLFVDGVKAAEARADELGAEVSKG